MSAATPGQAAYEAWCRVVFGYRHTPEWHKLAARDHAGWEAAARERPAPGLRALRSPVTGLIGMWDGMRKVYAPSAGEWEDWRATLGALVEDLVAQLDAIEEAAQERPSSKRDPLSCPCCVFGDDGCWCRTDCGAERCQARDTDAVSAQERPVPEPSRTEWVVFWGGETPDECAGWDSRDDEADAEEHREWITGGGVASRPVTYGPWTVTVPPPPAERGLLGDWREQKQEEGK